MDIGRGLAVTVAFTLALLAPTVALADEGGQSQQAKVLVLQAIALVVNTPDDVMAIDERIHDALEAADHEGVDLSVVEQAAAALDAGDLARTRDLLQTAIGAGPYLSSGVPEPIREGTGEPGRPGYAVGAEAGTTVVLDSYQPDSALDGGEWILIALSVVAVAAGVALSWRLRPADTVRQLRRAGRTSKEP